MRDPLWLSVGRLTQGVAEVPGPASNPLILRWAREIGAPAWYEDDDQAWCAVWLNRVLMACGLPMSGVGFELLRAKSFERWGVDAPGRQYGSVVVTTRPGGFHVGILTGERVGACKLLGGNTANAVGEAWFPHAAIVAARWAGPEEV